MYRVEDISKEWPKYNKRKGVPPTRKLSDIDMIIVHCTADEDLVGSDVYSIIKYHTNPNHVCASGCWTICYHYYIENVNGETVIWHTVPEEIRTFHAGVWNNRSIGVVIDKREKDEIDENKKDALVNLLTDLCYTFKINPYTGIWGHRHLYFTGWVFDTKTGLVLNKKTCPGILQLNYNFDNLRNDVSTLLLAKYNMKFEKIDPSPIYVGANEILLPAEAYNLLNTKSGLVLA